MFGKVSKQMLTKIVFICEKQITKSAIEKHRLWNKLVFVDKWNYKAYIHNVVNLYGSITPKIHSHSQQSTQNLRANQISSSASYKLRPMWCPHVRVPLCGYLWFGCVVYLIPAKRNHPKVGLYWDDGLAVSSVTNRQTQLKLMQK